jgi:hypothetical protein
MAKRRRTLDNFPAQFRDFVTAIIDEEEPFIPVERKNDRITLRSQLYQFFLAAREEAEKWRAEAKKDRSKWQNVPWFVEVETFAAKRQIQITPEGLKIIPKTRSSTALLLEAAMPKEKLAAIRAEDEARMAKDAGMTQEDINDIVKARGEEFARNFGAPESMIEEAKRVAAEAVGV